MPVMRYEQTTKLSMGNIRDQTMRFIQAIICIQVCSGSEDWKSSVVLPIYKGKGDPMECGSYRGINCWNML